MALDNATNFDRYQSGVGPDRLARYVFRRIGLKNLPSHYINTISVRLAGRNLGYGHL